jgi:PBP1b-binding outer membrane lipoprotein LpoB
MKRAILLSVLGIAVVLAGCGKSDEDKAKADVCDARADIEKNVNELKNLTLATATTDQIKSNINAIKDGVAKITDAQDKLSGARKEQVQKANETFKSQLNAVGADLGKSQSLEAAATQLKADISSLANAYEQSLAPIDCS